VKLGAGPNEASGPYWEEDKLMTGTREASADLTYPEGGGAQFKIFVMFKQIVSENNINERKKLLKTETENLSQFYKCNAADDAQKQGFNPVSDCITFDRWSGKIYILLDKYAIIRTEVSSKLWFWNNWVTSDDVIPCG
jgi:hypothetical protein